MENQQTHAKRETASHMKIRELDKGHYFGEVSYLFNTVASATVCATNYTSLGYLEKEKVDELFTRFPIYKT